MTQQFDETTMLDDETLNFGTSTDFKMKYDSAAGRFEILDAADNILGYIVDDGASGTFSWLGILSHGPRVEHTIATGAFTATASNIDVDTQADAATDDLDTISGTGDGDLIFLTAENVARVVTVKHATGNIQLLHGDFVMNAASAFILLKSDGTNLREVIRSNGGLAGTYTPTITGVANVTASTARVCQYSRNGSTCTVSGSVNVTQTAGATFTQVGISLPFASAIANAFEVGGSCGIVTAAVNVTGIALADVANNRAELDYVCDAAAATAREIQFHFTYQII